MDHIGHNAGKGQGAAAGLERHDRGRRNHKAAGFGLPPGIHNRAAFFADMLVVPAPGFGVDRLTNRPQQAQGGHRVFVRPLFTRAHKAANRRRRGVENRDLILFDQFPPAVGVRIARCAFVHDAGCAQNQGAVDDVAMTSDPTGVSGTPVDIIFFEIKDILERGGNVNLIAATSMQLTFRLAGGAGGVENEHRVFGVHLLGRAVGTSLRPQVMPPEVAPFFPLHSLTGALIDNHALDDRGFLQRLINNLFEIHGLVAQPGAIAGHDHFALRIVNAVGQGLFAKAAIDNAMNGADFGNRQHRNG